MDLAPFQRFHRLLGLPHCPIVILYQLKQLCTVKLAARSKTGEKFYLNRP
jgi:hypothetical protein